MKAKKVYEDVGDILVPKTQSQIAKHPKGNLHLKIKKAITEYLSETRMPINAEIPFKIILMEGFSPYSSFISSSYKIDYWLRFREITDWLEGKETPYNDLFENLKAVVTHFNIENTDRGVSLVLYGRNPKHKAPKKMAYKPFWDMKI